MTKEQALAILQATIEFSKKEMPPFDTEAFDEYRIEQHALHIRSMRAMREHPDLSNGVSEPRATPATKL
jgi:hypothetical protein